MVACDEHVLRIDIRTIIAWTDKRRSRNAEVDFLRARIPQNLDNSRARGSPDNGVVYEDDPLAIDYALDRVLFDAHEILSRFLSGSNKRPSDVFILDQANSIGNSRCLRIAHSRIET